MLSLVSACALRPSQEEIANADYGAYPTDYAEIIRSHMARRLKDPYSARYDFLNEPLPGWQGGLGGVVFGYRVCVLVNAKNSYGGYTGAKLYFFMIKDGRVVKTIGGDSEYSQAAAKGACENV